MKAKTQNLQEYQSSPYYQRANELFKINGGTDLSNLKDVRDLDNIAKWLKVAEDETKVVKQVQDTPITCRAKIEGLELGATCPGEVVPGSSFCAYHKKIMDIGIKGTKETVNHPSHYGGDTPHETIKCLAAWGLEKDALLWNAVKYISRAGKKGSLLEDLQKAAFYLQRRIDEVKDSSKVVVSYIAGDPPKQYVMGIDPGNQTRCLYHNQSPAAKGVLIRCTYQEGHTGKHSFEKSVERDAMDEDPYRCSSRDANGIRCEGLVGHTTEHFYMCNVLCGTLFQVTEDPDRWAVCTNHVDHSGPHTNKELGRPMSYERKDILWNDGIQIHACIGDRMDNQNPETFLVWTLCDKDVPPSKGYVGCHSDTTCEICQKAIRVLQEM